MDIKDLAKIKVNDAQNEAIQSIDGPVLVIAGPGTGKTQVLSLRIANILTKTDAVASNILCLTFTESGVSAMRERLRKYIGTDAYYVKIHTFHSFCNEIILSNPTKFSFSKELRQLDDLNKVKLIREIIEEIPPEGKNPLKPLHDSYAYQKPILNAIQTLKREGVTPDLLLKKTNELIDELVANPKINKKTGKPTLDWQTSYDQQLKSLELHKVYQEYQNKITKNGFYDYEDMILFVTNKMSSDSELLAELQEKHLYILVDEYQDTNGSQNDLLRILASFDESPNIFAVGDDDQAIFRFQGANVENLLSFNSNFKDVKKISLINNYRSSQYILDTADSLIEKNELRLSNLLPEINKKLHAELNIQNEKSEIYEFDLSEYETRFITEKIKELNGSGVKLSDIAVFYRNHADADDLIDSLLKQKIPFNLAAGSNLLDKEIIVQLINLLKSIIYIDPDRDFILFKILFYDFLNFERLDAFRVTNYSSVKKESLFEVISSEEKLHKSGVTNHEAFLNLAKNIAKWRGDSENMNIIEFIEMLIEESGYLHYIFFKNKDIENMNALNSFYNYFKSIYQENKNVNLALFLEDLNVLIENNILLGENALKAEKEGVNLMSAHKSKGLEFPYVFIIHLYDSNWEKKSEKNFFKLPTSQLNLGDKVSKVEDERRLLYVAMTRAKNKLFLSYSKEYLRKGNSKKVSPSQFIYELDKSLVEFKDGSQYQVENPEYFLQRLTSNHLKDYTESESSYLKSVVQNFKLSASAFLTYIECPLKFKYEYLIKIPRPMEKSSTLGSGIHFALEKLAKILQTGGTYSLSEIIDSYNFYLNKHLYNQNDIAQLSNEGGIILRNYLENYKGTFAEPAEIEYVFHQSETILDIPGSDPITLRGKLDKLEWIDKSQNSVRIVDYKVKDPESKKEIMGLTKAANPRMYYQLIFYKILAECDKYFKPKGSLNKYRVDEVQIDFIKPNKSKYFKKVSFEISDEEVMLVKEKIIDVVQRIRNLEFLGTSEYPLCKECDYCKESFREI